MKSRSIDRFGFKNGDKNILVLKYVFLPLCVTSIIEK